MKIYILGICGTFMAGVALLARAMGHEVSGVDENVYPPMSDALRDAGIEVHAGYDVEKLSGRPDYVIIGNALSRGNALVEYILNNGLPYISGPQWLADNVLAGRHVLAVAGTHGKTTTSSLLTWILTQAGLNPGYLIGGIPKNFEQSAVLGQAPYFVIEADEYDSAFFDKRSKFIHYRPRTLILNNLEYDHADIFPDLLALKTQFQYLLRTVPKAGLIIRPEKDPEIDDVMARGCWSTVQLVGGERGVWRANLLQNDASCFELWHRDQKLGVVEWSLCGQHNVHNALVAVAAAFDVGVSSGDLLSGLRTFQNVKRRMEVRGVVNDITIYDDFAHHPTAIATTLAGLRARVNQQRIIAVIEFGSFTMRTGVHRSVMAGAFRDADMVFALRPQASDWDARDLESACPADYRVFPTVNDILSCLKTTLSPEDHVLIMSNKGFDGIHQRLLTQMEKVS